MSPTRLWIRTCILIGVMLMLGVALDTSYSTTRAVSWPRPTYNDGTPIEPGNDTYSLWRQDNVTGTITQIANRMTGLSITFDDSTLVKGRRYNFWGQTVLVTGASSDNSPILAWVNPTGRANPPALVVQ